MGHLDIWYAECLVMETDPVGIICGLTSGRVELYSRITHLRWKSSANIGTKYIGTLGVKEILNMAVKTQMTYRYNGWFLLNTIWRIFFTIYCWIKLHSSSACWPQQNIQCNPKAITITPAVFWILIWIRIQNDPDFMQDPDLNDWCGSRSGAERIRIKMLCSKTWILMFAKLNLICQYTNTGFKLVER